MTLNLPRSLKPIKINDISSTLLKLWGRTECETRCKLATAYRLTNYSGWDELIYGHITLRVPGTEHILINPFGMHYNEITAGSLVKIDLTGNVIDKGTSNFSFQKTGYVIHSSIHETRPDLEALIHIHSREGLAVASSVDKLQPICQHSVFIEPMSYHKYHGIVVDDQEKSELAKSFLAPSKCLLMRNHGLMTGGSTIEEAFLLMFFLHTTCKVYIDAGYTHRGVPKDKVLSGEVVKKSLEAAKVVMEGGPFGKKDFEALARQLDNAGLETGYPYGK